MVKQFWLNLPVKDIAKSKAFFAKMGFRFNPQYGNSDNSASLLIGEKDVVVMLFEEAFFKNCSGGNGVVVSSATTEVLLSIDAQSKEEVDEMAKKAVEAGGTSSHQPTEMNGWMYGCLFADVDGHRWNVLYMDMSKMPK